MGLRLSKPGTHWIAVTRSPYLALTKQPSTVLTKKGFWSSGMECLVRQCWRGCQDTPQMYQRCWITERESRALAAWFYRPLVTFVCSSDIFPFLRHEWPLASYYREKNMSKGESKRKKKKKGIFSFFAAYHFWWEALGTRFKKNTPFTPKAQSYQMETNCLL